MGELKALDAGMVQEAARLLPMLPYLEEYIHKLDKALEQKTFTKLDKGELTPDMALYAWQEKMAYRRLLRHFNQQVRIGQAIAAEHSEEM